MEAKKRNKIACNGWKNWDTWEVFAYMDNVEKIYNYVSKNKFYLLTLKKMQILNLLNSVSGGLLKKEKICFKNVSAKQLKEKLKFFND